MQLALTAPVIRLKEISKRLYALDSTQSTFIHIETLFLEALYISRENHNELDRTDILPSLLRVKENEYKLSQAYYRSIKSKEKYIRNFKHYFKKVLDKAIAQLPGQQ